MKYIKLLSSTVKYGSTTVPTRTIATLLCSLRSSTTGLLGCPKYTEQVLSLPMSSSSPHTELHDAKLEDLLGRLKHVSTSSLCDADKSLRGEKQKRSRVFLRGVISSTTLPLRSPSSNVVMTGIARTVQCTVEDEIGDFLAIVHALRRSCTGDVLVIDASKSVVAVSGGLFAMEASRQRLAGVVLDGPCRDISDIQSMEPPFPFYSKSTNPYSGAMKDIGRHQIPVTIGQDALRNRNDTTTTRGVKVCPGDIVVGDADGIAILATDMVASMGASDGDDEATQHQYQNAQTLVETAEAIEQKERQWMKQMKDEGESLIDLLKKQS